MIRRFYVIVDVNDKVPGAMLEVLTSTCNLMKDLKGSDILIDYGVDLICPDMELDPSLRIPVIPPEEHDMR